MLGERTPPAGAMTRMSLAVIAAVLAFALGWAAGEWEAERGEGAPHAASR